MVSPAPKTNVTPEMVWQWLAQVVDPEIPNVNIVEMGIVREVLKQQAKWQITITPTYSGCPAMQMIEKNIATTLAKHGLKEIQVRLSYAPPWGGDWLSESARKKLEEVGIAAPKKSCQLKPKQSQFELPTACPFCQSLKTELRSAFGSTACKALYFCKACQQPFDSFKTI